MTDQRAPRTGFPPEHELHRRRFGRNLGLGLVLAAFVALVFGLTIVKITNLDHAQDAPGVSGGSATTGTATARTATARTGAATG
ncbi:hypothetical protein [Frigidibacter sp. MR17.24]|uniref:hypothetical protein n=1 Tax=Frigidibacter sp. MR17.24 TaxID=3127345 RepID=UPI003012DC97